MLVYRYRRWPSIKPTTGQRLMFVGLRASKVRLNMCRGHVSTTIQLEWSAMFSRSILVPKWILSAYFNNLDPLNAKN